jgi:hypothetical protein
MNARQKAKKYKKDLDRLKRLDKPMIIERQSADITPLRAKLSFNRQGLCTFDPVTRDKFIYREIIRALINTDDFVDCLNIVYENDFIRDMLNVSATIKIVKEDK